MKLVALVHEPKPRAVPSSPPRAERAGGARSREDPYYKTAVIRRLALGHAA